ncbi:MAG: SPASM domain-containing protein [Planctomycetes bacterium]|nr:SPASM domain-containing protein [Planctomycetota bacterium]
MRHSIPKTQARHHIRAVQPGNRCGTEPSNRYAIGDLRQGADRSRCHFRDFSQRIRRGQYPCHACPVLPVCGGMCPKKWADGESPCPSVRYNLKERLLVAYAAGRLV